MDSRFESPRSGPSRRLVRVAFSDVQSLRSKRGMSTAAKVWIGVSIVLGVGALVAYLTLSAIRRNG